jgi:hypothetical protein
MHRTLPGANNRADVGVKHLVEGALDTFFAKMATAVWSFSKKSANYQPAARAEVRCDRCKYMFPRLAFGGCRLVRGMIRGSASCYKFMPRRRS